MTSTSVLGTARPRNAPVRSPELAARLEELDSDAFAGKLTAHYAEAIASAVKIPRSSRGAAKSKKR